MTISPRFLFRPLLAAICAASCLAPVHAQDKEVPYWATIRFEEVNMRVGPSQEYKIDWVYHRRGLPVKVIRVREGWRLVEDPEGTRGWIAASQLHPDRGTLVIGKGLADIRADANRSSALQWRAQPGVVAKLGRCRENWCEVDVGGRKGWMQADRLWGTGKP